MAPIIDSIEINRSPEDVFAYVDDLGKHSEWQEQIVSVHVETEGPTHVGTRATDKPPAARRPTRHHLRDHSARSAPHKFLPRRQRPHPPRRNHHRRTTRRRHTVEDHTRTRPQRSRSRPTLRAARPQKRPQRRPEKPPAPQRDPRARTLTRRRPR